ncbi:hypothetical protein SDC9_76033 [bioreactor metagenome]|uniref:Uncharacterized protein n=1 Tax=bioreactor metagenome TaxID=1076179 RepID=A0A644YSP0_9ZZZZ
MAEKADSDAVLEDVEADKDPVQEADEARCCKTEGV